MNQQVEVEWYKKHGIWSERIKVDNSGNQFVVGDFCWHLKIRKCSACGHVIKEYIEPRMKSDGIYKYKVIKPHNQAVPLNR